MAMVARCDNCNHEKEITDGAYNTLPAEWVEIDIRKPPAVNDVHAQVCGLACATEWCAKQVEKEARAALDAAAAPKPLKALDDFVSDLRDLGPQQ